MSLKDKLNEVARYIKTEYPVLNFENVSVSDSCVTNICNIIIKKGTDHKLRKSIVNAMNIKNSSLNKCIKTMNCNDVINTSVMNNSTIIKCIENCNYTSIDFLNYNNNILSDICKHIKVTVNSVNRYKVYRKCKEHFNMNSSTGYFNENSGIENCISYSDHASLNFYKKTMFHLNTRVYHLKVITVG